MKYVTISLCIKNRVNPEMHQKSCFRTKISLLWYYSTEKYAKYTKILWCRFEVGVGVGFADISKCRCRCRPTSKSWSRWITTCQFLRTVKKNLFKSKYDKKEYECQFLQTMKKFLAKSKGVKKPVSIFENEITRSQEPMAGAQNSSNWRGII